MIWGLTYLFTFRLNASIVEKDKDFITASVTAPKKAVLKFALMNAPAVEILDPPELRQKVERIFQDGAKLNN